MALSDLRALIAAYVPPPGASQDAPQRFLDLIDAAGEECLFRHHFAPGHITGSALLISPDGQRCLLNHHKFLNKWLCFGGHADGDTDILAVAARETAEESGILRFTPFVEGVADMDIHPVPFNQKKNEPAHLHFDIRTIFQAQDEAFTQSDESAALEWVTYDEAKRRTADDAAMQRQIAIWKEKGL